MNLSKYSDQAIHDLIESMQSGIAIKPDSEESKALKVSISRAYAELERRAQKKTGTANPTQTEPNRQEFFKKQAQEYRESGRDQLADKVEREVQDAHKAQAESAKAFDLPVERRRIAFIPNPEPITVPVVAIEFKTQKGDIEMRDLDQVDIISLLKTYFKRVACSKAMEGKRYSDAYGSDMGKIVYKLFQGWNVIYNETQEGGAWPALVDCFPGYNRASKLQQVNAEMLWRWATNEK